LSLSHFGSTRTQDIAKENSKPLLDVPYSSHSHLAVTLPRLVGTMLGDTNHIERLSSIYSPAHVHASSAFGFTAAARVTPSEVDLLANGEPLKQLSFFAGQARRPRPALADSPLSQVWQEYLKKCAGARQDELIFLPSATAPPAELRISDRRFVYQQHDTLQAQPTRDFLYGLSHTAQESEEDVAVVDERYPYLPFQGYLAGLSKIAQPAPPMRVPQLAKLIMDSGKLAKLDELLPRLRAEGHRVLVYFQMTRMIDLMEEYLAFRQYK
jgi:hypothetical protein